MKKNKTIKKKTTKKTEPLEYVDASSEEMEKLYSLFNETEYADINRILDGAAGMTEY